jgi:hypothetical protein
MMAPIKEKEMKYMASSGEEHTVIVSIIPLVGGRIPGHTGLVQGRYRGSKKI